MLHFKNLLLGTLIPIAHGVAALFIGVAAIGVALSGLGGLSQWVANSFGGDVHAFVGLSHATGPLVPFATGLGLVSWTVQSLVGAAALLLLVASALTGLWVWLARRFKA